eukprot:1983191-Rhodomonas_salina.1
MGSKDATKRRPKIAPSPEETAVKEEPKAEPAVGSLTENEINNLVCGSTSDEDTLHFESVLSGCDEPVSFASENLIPTCFEDSEAPMSNIWGCNPTGDVWGDVLSVADVSFAQQA